MELSTVTPHGVFVPIIISAY